MKEGSIPNAIQKKLKSLGVDCDYKRIGDIYIKIEKSKPLIILIDGVPLGDYNFVFLRTIGNSPVSREVGTIVARECERLGIEYMDKVHNGYITDNKLISGYLLNVNNVPVPKTLYKGVFTEEYLENIRKEIGFPLVIKKTDSEKAKDVFLINNEEDLLTFKKENGIRGYIIQEAIISEKDCRVYLIDGVAGFTVLRKSDEIIKNVNTGAIREYIEPSEEMARTAINAAKATGLAFTGVDILESKDKNYYVLEVNRAPAFSAEYGPEDRFDFVAEYIAEKII